MSERTKVMKHLNVKFRKFLLSWRREQNNRHKPKHFCTIFPQTYSDKLTSNPCVKWVRLLDLRKNSNLKSDHPASSSAAAPLTAVFCSLFCQKLYTLLIFQCCVFAGAFVIRRRHLMDIVVLTTAKEEVKGSRLKN